MTVSCTCSQAASTPVCLPNGCDVCPPPPQERLALWDRLKARADAEVAAKEPQSITVTLPDGKQVEAQSWRTTPYDVAKGIRSVPVWTGRLFGHGLRLSGKEYIGAL